jgi:hypothetical protein
LIDPIAQYDHDEGISITGGFVYRGTQINELKGLYVFGDWSHSFVTPSGRLFYLDANNRVREFRRPENQPLDLFVAGFGQDAAGELYLMGSTNNAPFSNASGQNVGVVLRITKVPPLIYLPVVQKAK